MNRDEARCAAWLRAVRTGAIEREILEIHDEIARRIERRDPVCTASGRCCHFEKFGHRLYTTALEVALTLDRIPNERALQEADIERARMGGTCPFVVDRFCGVHPVRPIGCRVFFCDPTADDFVREIAEMGVQRIKRLHEAHDIAYLYGEWRTLLSMFAASGEAFPTRPVQFAPSDPFVTISVNRA